MKWSVGASAFELLFNTYQGKGLPAANPTGEQAAVLFPDLRSWPHSDEKWLDMVRRQEGVKEAAILKNAGSRGDISCSADRHAYVILAGDKITESTKFLQSQGALS